MAPNKKTTNKENNLDAVEFYHGDVAEWFNWICIGCKGKAIEPISKELQYIGDNVVYQDIDSSYWFHCEKCNTSFHHKCLLGFCRCQVIQTIWIFN